MNRPLPHKLLPLMAIAVLTAGCVSDGFMLPDIDDGASRRGGTPIYPGPGDLPYLYGYPAPFGDPWYGYGYSSWPPYLYYGPYGYGYGYGMGYGPGYGYWPYPPRPPVYDCRDTNGDGRCDHHPNRPAQPRDPVQPGGVPWPVDPARPGVPGDVTPRPSRPGAPPPPVLFRPDDAKPPSRGSGGTPRSEREHEDARRSPPVPPPPPAPGISQRDNDRAAGSRGPPDDRPPEL